jgi:hypothetical protein
MLGAFRHTIYQRKSERPAEVHKKIFAVYGNFMNRQNVTKWCREFSVVCTVHDGHIFIRGRVTTSQVRSVVKYRID